MTLLEPGLAFIEGIALIASPCILPVLPLVLSASADGGRRRPFGIIAGFIIAFSLFAFAARKIVGALGVDTETIKDISLVLLFALGLVMLSSKLSEKFSALTQGLAGFGNTTGNNDGFFSGVTIGALIGLVWTPCAGPVLAAVLVQVIRQQTDLAGYFIILSFSVGAGLPMLAVALTGRALVQKAGFLTRHTEALRRTFGALIIGSVLLIASGVDIASLLPRQAAAPVREALQLEHALPQPWPAPEFSGDNIWLNSPPLTMAGLKGKVVLIDFWTYSCINCVRTLPYITDWDKKYRDQGLVIVGVHAPEFEFEKKQENVLAAIAAHGIKYPVSLDNVLSTWTNFNNRYWPAHYLIDREGRVVYTHFGEGAYDVTENNIRFLLGITGKVTNTAEQSFSNDQTPEIYLGSERRRNFDGTANGPLPLHHWTLSDGWNTEGEKIVSAAAGAMLKLHFRARKVFLVMGTADGAAHQVTISVNGTTKTLTVDRNTLYELTDLQTLQDAVLELKADTPGLEAYAFTFGL